MYRFNQSSDNGYRHYEHTAELNDQAVFKFLQIRFGNQLFVNNLSQYLCLRLSLLLAVAAGGEPFGNGECIYS